MNEYVLSCCSTADLPKEYFEKRNISYVCFKFYIDGKEYRDDLGQTIPYKEFYKKMTDGAVTSTSQANVQDYIDYFSAILESGKDIFHLSFSSGLSGSYNSARIAKAELDEKYPDRKLVIVDSLCASSGYGLFIDTLADMRDNGATIEELYEFAMANRLKIHHWFFSTDLTFYVRGGRISKAAGWFGTILKICPLLDMNCKGKLVPRLKLRGKANAITEIVKKMEEYADGGKDYNGKCYMCHSDCIEDAREVAALVKKTFPKINGDIMINDIGTVIGSHSGPGTVAVFFFGSERGE